MGSEPGTDLSSPLRGPAETSHWDVRLQRAVRDVCAPEGKTGSRNGPAQRAGICLLVEGRKHTKKYSGRAGRQWSLERLSLSSVPGGDLKETIALAGTIATTIFYKENIKALIKSCGEVSKVSWVASAQLLTHQLIRHINNDKNEWRKYNKQNQAQRNPSWRWCQPFRKAVKVLLGILPWVEAILENNRTPALLRRAVFLKIPQTDGVYCIPQQSRFWSRKSVSGVQPSISTH